MLSKLVNNLTAGEKRYLSLNLSVYKNGALDKKYLKKLIEGKIDINSISALSKNILQTKILKLLADYAGQNKTDHEILSIISQADYLCKKKLYDEAHKLYNKAMDKSIHTENYALYFFALKKTENNLLKMQKLNKIQFHITQKSKEIKIVSERLFSLANYSLNTCKAMYLSRKNHNPKTKIEQKEFISFLNNELLKNDSMINDFSTAFRYYSAHALINYELGNIPQTLKFLKKQENLILNKPHLMQDYMDEYVSVIYNMAVINMSQKKYADTESQIKKLDELPIDDIDLITQTQSSLYLLKINCYYESGQYDKLFYIENELNEYMHKYSNPVLKLVSSYILSLVYLYKNNYKKSREYLNNILNDKNDNYREDIFCFARIINIIIQFEKSDYDALPYSIINAKNYLIKKKRYHPLERVFIFYIDKILKRPESRVEYLKMMHKEMKQLTEKNKLLVKTLEYFDFISWIDKITNKHYSSL